MEHFLDRCRGVPDRLRRAVEAHHRLDDPLLLTFIVVATLSAGGSGWLIHDVFDDLPDNRTVRNVENMAQATTLLDVHDRPAFTIYQERRIEVPLSRMSPHLLRAIVVTEDQRFYEHGGVDFVRIAGAAIMNLREGRAAQGASTITQQLARQTFLGSGKTLRRKLKEAIVAQRIEREFSKEEILQLYLNKVYFGDGLYGAEAASLGFFGKHASDLDVPEAALLAGLVKSPSAYAPTIDGDRAVRRRNVVLQAMRDAGAIDAATYRAAVQAPLHLVDSLRQDEPYGQYFREEVRKQLVEQFGWERVYQGGLQVHTTLDLDMQKSAEAEVQRALAEIERRQARSRSGNTVTPPEAPLQAALVALDPLTGEVRAMVGGRDFGQSHFNRAVQARRQPGSAFKPFVYAAALERGYTPASLITRLDEPVQTYEGAWAPADEHLESSAITMRAALRTSSNRAAVRMLQEIGIPETVQYAQRLGVGSVPSVPSLALGSGEVTVLSMTVAFGAFANQGVLSEPTLVRRVETTGGEVLYEARPQSRRAISETTAFMMTSMLSDVIDGGTAWQARREGFTLPAAGKTGTTNDYRDAWFVGYTPKLVTTVWIGYDQPRTIVARGYAADLAVPLWGRFMKIATRHDPPQPFRPPPNLVGVAVCRVSGQLAVDGCRDAIVAGSDGTLSRKSTVYTEYFVRGTEPIDVCPVHTNVLDGRMTLGTTGSPLVPPPSPPDALHVSPSSVPDEVSTPPPPVSTPPPVEVTKRGGFWSRLFRRDGNSPKQDPQGSSTPPSDGR